MLNQHLIMPITRQQILQIFSSPWLPKIANVIILALFSWWAVVNVLPLFDEKKIIVAPKTAVKISTVPAKISIQNINLFGAPETSAPKNKKEAKPTKLNLTLRGILATDDPAQGVAQIQNENNEERHFVVNDSVFSKATLAEIYPDRVILLHNGHREALVLPEKFLNLKHFSVEKQIRHRKKTATEYRNIFLNSSGEDKLKLFGFDTAYKDGGFTGFVIKALGPKGIEMMDILGVKDGDIIVVVNDLRFSETLEAAEQLKDLKYATSVDVIIDRDGEEIPFHFDFDTPIADKIDVGNSENNFSDSTTNSAHGDTRSLPTRNPHENKITEDGKVDRSGFTQNLIDSRDDDDDEDLDPDWDEAAEAEEYRLKQLERRTGVPAQVEIDH